MTFNTDILPDVKRVAQNSTLSVTANPTLLSCFNQAVRDVLSWRGDALLDSAENLITYSDATGASTIIVADKFKLALATGTAGYWLKGDAKDKLHAQQAVNLLQDFKAMVLQAA